VCAAAPVASVMELAATVPIRLIPLTHDSFVKPNAVTNNAVDMVIPGGSYKGIDEDIKTQAFPVFILASKTLDSDVAYQLLEVLHGENKKRDRIHPAAKGYNLGDAFTGVIGQEDRYVPFHEGAIKYYKEKGVWDKLKK